MDEGPSFAVSAVEVLKASGPQGRAMSQCPILVTYRPATTNTPGLLLWVWTQGRGGKLGCNRPRDDKKPDPPARTVHLKIETANSFSGSLPRWWSWNRLCNYSDV